MILRLKNVAIALCPVLVAAVLAGCSSTTVVSRQTTWVQGDTISVNNANGRISGRWVTITMRDGTTLEANHMVLGIDSCKLLPVGSTLPLFLPSSAIATIQYRDHLRGLLSGFLAGAVLMGSAMVVPAVIGKAEGGGGIVFIGVVGAVAGTLLGGIIGDDIRYQIELVPVPPEMAHADQNRGKRLICRIVVHEETAE